MLQEKERQAGEDSPQHQVEEAANIDDANAGKMTFLQKKGIFLP